MVRETENAFRSKDGHPPHWTSLPASRFRIFDRGLLRPGA